MFFTWTGLKILGSVCDQANAPTINALVASNAETKTRPNSGELLTYKLGDTYVIHCYDPPHLLKGTRNNLLTKNLTHYVSERWNGSDGVSTDDINTKDKLAASWDDIVYVYEESLKGSCRMLPKITPEHISPSKRKLRVSVASQIFSRSFGNVMKKFSSENATPSRTCYGTAQIMYFFNDLFDSVNGSKSKENALKSPVTSQSVHFQYWEYALNMLQKMQYVDKTNLKATNRTKNIQNWQSTIRGYAELSKKCFNVGINKVALR